MLSVHKTTVFFFKSTSKHEKQQKGTGTGRQFMLTAQTKTMERDWHWTSISAIFGFTFWTRVLLQIYMELTDKELLQLCCLSVIDIETCKFTYNLICIIM